MNFDFFTSKLNRNDLADVYSSYYRALMGGTPTVDPAAGRAELCDLIEELVELSKARAY